MHKVFAFGAVDDDVRCGFESTFADAETFRILWKSIRTSYDEKGQCSCTYRYDLFIVFRALGDEKEDPFIDGWGKDVGQVELDNIRDIFFISVSGDRESMKLVSYHGWKTNVCTVPRRS